MGLLSFGGGKSTSSSSSSSRSEDRSRSGSVSGGFAVGGSESSQSIAFEDIFAKLFGGAADTAFGLDPSTLTSQANTLFGGGLGFIDQLSGGASEAYLTDRVSGESPVLQEQIDALGADIGKFFNEQINPAITSEAVAGGTLGGGRQGVAQGLAAEAAGKEFQRGALGLRAGDIAARDAAAGTLGNQEIGRAGTALGALPGLFSLAYGGFTSPLAGYSALSDIVGGPTALTSSSSFNSAEDFARAFSESYGFSESESSSTSKSKNIKLGFG